MKSSYTLKPSNFTFVLDNHFPKIDPNRKMGVFISGGMESSLIMMIAREYYGKDRVLPFYSDDIFSSRDPSLNRNIRTNIDRAVKLFDIEPIYLEFNYELHVSDRKSSIENKMKDLKKNYGVEFVMFGFTKLFFDVEIFKDPSMTIPKIMEIAYSDTVKYKSTIEEFHLATNEYTQALIDIDIPAEVYPILRSTTGFIKSPFKDLNKSEVVDFYRQLDILDKLYGTSSCIKDSLTFTGKHCGECFNCQQRWDAFKILNDPSVIDKTEYVSDKIKLCREKLEHVIHS